MKKTKVFLLTLISLLILALATPLATFAATDADVVAAAEAELAAHGMTLSDFNKGQISNFLMSKPLLTIPFDNDDAIAAFQSISAQWASMGAPNFVDLSAAQQAQLISAASAELAALTGEAAVNIGVTPFNQVAITITPTSSPGIVLSYYAAYEPNVVTPTVPPAPPAPPATYYPSTSLIKQTGSNDVSPFVGGIVFLGLLGAALLFARKKGLFTSN